MATDLAAHTPPTPADLLAARGLVASMHPRTPLRRLRRGDDIYVKCEDETEIRSFKGRGALWRLASLKESGSGRGVITASTGNHGQGIAYAAAHFGTRSVVVVPEGASELKMNRIRDLGAELRVMGADIGEAADEAYKASEREGLTYLEDGEDPALMAGAATVAWEILEQLPAVDRIVVPVGGGNLIAGVALMAKRLKPTIKVVGVQSEAAPAVVRSWEEGRVVELPCRTSAGGLATRFPGRLAFEVIQELVDEMCLVSEAELAREVQDALAIRATLIEGAAAAPFAALRRYSDAWASGCTVLVQSGANISLAELQTVLATVTGDKERAPSSSPGAPVVPASYSRRQGTEPQRAF
jgi:threonine dehydratase